MANVSTGLLGVWCDCAPEAEAEWNRWYDNEHVPERAGISGFRNGRRYRAVSGRPRYLALYDLDSPSAMGADAYRARLDNPTPWTTAMMPQFRNFVRSVFTTQFEAGEGYGGVVATMRFRVLRDPETAVALLRPLLDRPGVLRVRLCAADEALSCPPSTERDLRAEADSWAPWAILVDGRDGTSLRTALAADLPTSALRGAGLRGAVRRGVYRLLRGIGD